MAASSAAWGWLNPSHAERNIYEKLYSGSNKTQKNPVSYQIDEQLTGIGEKMGENA